MEFEKLLISKEQENINTHNKCKNELVTLMNKHKFMDTKNISDIIMGYCRNTYITLEEKHLTEKNVNILVQNNNYKIMIKGETLLGYLIRRKNNKFKSFKVLKEDLLVLDNNKQSPLYWLCIKEHIDIIDKYEFKREAFLVLDNDKQSPLYWLCFKGHKNIIDEYEFKREDFLVLSNGGKSPLYWLKKNNMHEIMKKYNL